MKLLFLSTAFPQPGHPSLAPYNLRLCEALAADHELIVVSPVPWTRSARAERPDLSLPRVWYPAFVYPPGVFHSAHAWFLWQSIRSTVRTAMEGCVPDAVISYWTWPDGAAAARLARSYGVPVVMMVGGSDVLLASGRGTQQRIARTLSQADAVVTVGKHLRREIEALGVPPARISIVRRGVNGDVFSPGPQRDAREHLGLSDDEGLLLWVGRLAHVKGPDLLLAALEQLVKRSSRTWRCAIAGDGPLQEDLLRRVSGGALRGRVSFLGTLGPRQLADWYRAADALVISSRSEGVPNVLYEAQACGTPVVAMEAGDIADMLGDGDVQVPPGDVERLAQALSDTLRTPPRRRRSRALPTWRDSAAALVAVIDRVRSGVPTPAAEAVPGSMASA